MSKKWFFHGIGAAMLVGILIPSAWAQSPETGRSRGYYGFPDWDSKGRGEGRRGQDPKDASEGKGAERRSDFKSGFSGRGRGDLERAPEPREVPSDKKGEERKAESKSHAFKSPFGMPGAFGPPPTRPGGWTGGMAPWGGRPSLDGQGGFPGFGGKSRRDRDSTDVPPAKKDDFTGKFPKFAPLGKGDFGRFGPFETIRTADHPKDKKDKGKDFEPKDFGKQKEAKKAKHDKKESSHDWRSAPLKHPGFSPRGSHGFGQRPASDWRHSRSPAHHPTKWSKSHHRGPAAAHYGHAGRSKYFGHSSHGNHGRHPARHHRGNVGHRSWGQGKTAHGRRGSPHRFGPPSHVGHWGRSAQQDHGRHCGSFGRHHASWGDARPKKHSGRSIDHGDWRGHQPMHHGFGFHGHPGMKSHASQARGHGFPPSFGRHPGFDGPSSFGHHPGFGGPPSFGLHFYGKHDWRGPTDDKGPAKRDAESKRKGPSSLKEPAPRGKGYSRKEVSSRHDESKRGASSGSNDLEAKLDRLMQELDELRKEIRRQKK